MEKIVIFLAVIGGLVLALGAISALCRLLGFQTAGRNSQTISIVLSDAGRRLGNKDEPR